MRLCDHTELNLYYCWLMMEPNNDDTQYLALGSSYLVRSNMQPERNGKKAAKPI